MRVIVLALLVYFPLSPASSAEETNQVVGAERRSPSPGRGELPFSPSRTQPAPQASSKGNPGLLDSERNQQANLLVDVRQPNGQPLLVTASVRIVAGKLTFEENAEAAQRSRAIFRKLPLGPLAVRVSAEGFAPIEVAAVLDSHGLTRRVLVHLRTLTKELAQGGTWVPALSTRDVTLYSRSIEALRAKKTPEAEKYFARLLHDAPGHADVNYLAGVIAYRRNETASATVYFSKAAYLNPESEEAARALGSALYRGGNYTGALQAFSTLTRMRPDSWDAEWAAASAAFRAGAYERAREHASLAAEHAVRPEPVLLLALANSQLRRRDETLQAAQDFLALGGDSPLAATARELIASSKRTESFILEPAPPVSPAGATAALISEDLIEPRLPTRLWAPPDVDDTVPVFASNATCSQAEVIRTGSREVERMASGIGEVGASEEISQEELDGLGHGHRLERFDTNYGADIRILRGGQLSVDEYRSRSRPEAVKGEPPVVHGLVGLALIFHPQFLDDFTFRCEGLTEWKGQEAWSVYFTQRQDRPGRLHVFMDGGRAYPAYVKGRALVNKVSSEILHIETDLLVPIPALQLEQEHLVVDYSPVSFQITQQRFWLPSQADLYVHIYGRLFHVRHRLHDYITFKVDTRQDIHAPKEQPAKP